MLVETEDAPFHPHVIWRAAWDNLEKKVNAKRESVYTEYLRADSRGDTVPDLSKRSRCIQPIAEFNSEGRLEWNDVVVEKIKALGVAPRGTRQRA